MRRMHDEQADPLGVLQARYWRLVRGLTNLCADLDRAGSDERKALSAAANALRCLTPGNRAMAFCRQDDGYVSIRALDCNPCERIWTAELGALLSRQTPMRGTASDNVLPVSADDFACFRALKRGRRDGLIGFLGGDHEPQGLLFLWPKDVLHQEHEDVFTVVASCLNSTFAMAAEAEARVAIAEKEVEAAKREVDAWRDMATKIAHLTTTPLVLAECEMRRILDDRAPATRARLSAVRVHLHEANEAIDRAYMFEHDPRTAVQRPEDLVEVARAAALAAGVPLVGDSDRTASATVNRFRTWFAFRDVFVCMKSMANRVDGDTRVEIGCNGQTFCVAVVCRITVGRSFSPSNLFSPQHHVEVDCGESAPPAGISLFLARRLWKEETGGDVTPRFQKRHSRLSIEFRCKIPQGVCK